MADTGDAFWSFSLAFYGRPDVSEACLALQDRHGRDVNLVLYACWVGLSGRGRLEAAELARAEAVSRPWRRDVIETLRQARRAIKEVDRDGTLTALYEAAKAVELEAERVAQRRLAALAPTAGTRSAESRVADAVAGLALYLQDGAGHDAAAAIFAAIRQGGAVPS
jgi:uncharacterized protein (TIGR02444 family)